jgi:hypothetical protein
MTRFRVLSLLAAVAGSLFVAVPAYADEIVLWSGARLTGRIVDKSNDALVLETASSENVRIAWDDIFSLQTDAPQDAMLTRNDSAPRIPMAETGVAAAPQAPKTA